MTRTIGNPQVEHGYTRIANELLEALIRYPFSGGECKVVLALIRWTYGWQKTVLPIKQTDLAQRIGLHPRQVHRILAQLRQQAVVCYDRHTRPYTYRLNKAYFGWRDWPKELAPDMCATSQQAACELSGRPHANVSAAPDTSVRVSTKEKKEKDLPPPRHEPALEVLLDRFSWYLHRSLTPDEHALIQQLYAQSPAEAYQLVQQAAQPYHPPTPPPAGGSDAHRSHDSHR